VRYFACEEGVAVKAGDCPWPALGRLPKPARLALCTCCLACTWQAWHFLLLTLLLYGNVGASHCDWTSLSCALVSERPHSASHVKAR
jgi:hypothetical protein